MAEKLVEEKKYVVKTLLNDSEYRKKVFFIVGLLGIDPIETFVGDQGSSKQTR